MPVSTEMPKYRCYKEVWALKIKKVEADPDGAMLFPDDERYAPISVDEEYVVKHNPTSGGYFVKNEDGCLSFSPAEVFEGGYILAV